MRVCLVGMALAFGCSGGVKPALDAPRSDARKPVRAVCIGDNYASGWVTGGADGTILCAKRKPGVKTGPAKRCWRLAPDGSLHAHSVVTATSSTRGTGKKTGHPQDDDAPWTVESTDGEHSATVANKKEVVIKRRGKVVRSWKGDDVLLLHIRGVFLVGDTLFVHSAFAGPAANVIRFRVDGGPKREDVAIYGGGATVMNKHQIVFSDNSASNFSIYDARTRKFTTFGRTLPKLTACTKKMHSDLEIDLEHDGLCYGVTDPATKRCCAQLSEGARWKHSTMAVMDKGEIAFIHAEKRFGQVGIYSLSKKAITRNLWLRCTTVGKKP